MKNLFNLDNPVFQVLSRIADLVVLSLICLVCCVPVFTIGPALTALHKTVYDLTLERCAGTVKTYFRAFRSNFKQGVLAGLISLLAAASLVCDFLLLRLYYTGGAYTALVCLVFLLTFLAVGVMAYLFPLIARYENTMRQHFLNAALLMIRYLPRTIAMFFLHLFPLFLLLFAPQTLVYTLPFWIFVGFGALAQADAFLLRPVFQLLEKSKEDSPTEEEALPEE